MRLIFSLNHPAHFHLFRNAMNDLTKMKHEVLIVYKQKDVLEQLIQKSDFNYLALVRNRSVSHGRYKIIFSRIWELILHEIRLFRLSRKFKPDIFIGTDISITHIGRILKIPSFVFNEDDYRVNRFFCMASYPFANFIVSPAVCDVGKYSYKKISYNGYQKLAYLHPSRFNPDIEIVRRIIPGNNPFYLIRLVSLTAGHDVEKKHVGINEDIVQRLVDLLSVKGDVFISSEAPVKKKFEKYILKINPDQIHHFIYFADLFIADSQSMIVESAMLGTPSIRFNSFVGEISVLEELEETYNLTYGINSSEPEKLFLLVDKLLKTENLKNIFQERRQKMLRDKIDLTTLMISIFSNFPGSAALKKDFHKSSRYTDNK